MKNYERNTYEERVYKWLKRDGWADRFEYPGIYEIRINNQTVYVGKSKNMLRRLAQHWVGINTESERKYRILSEAKSKGHTVSFGVLHYAEDLLPQLLDEELGKKEGEFIRELKPVLNTQIPKADNWRSYEINKTASTITLSDILQQQNQKIQTEQISNISEDNFQKAED